MIKNKITLRVRYGETDQMGYVHHGNYAQYFEMGRIELLRAVGISYKKMEEQKIILEQIFENWKGKIPSQLITIGRVPMFFYIVHVYLCSFFFLILRLFG